jgi:hypothetical protein
MEQVCVHVLPLIDLISSVLIEKLLDVEPRNSESHIAVDVISTDGRARPFSLCPSVDSIEFLLENAKSFGQIIHAVHHETPDHVILKRSRRCAFNKSGDVRQVGQFIDRDDISIDQRHVRPSVGAFEIVREVKLVRTCRARTKKHTDQRTLMFNAEARLPTVVRTVSF